ncbi:MAG: hypothetical protein K2O04_07585 [Clostridiales bacterium]|nr:hypothetical protein [Clostridiales bacterium]
MNKTIIQNSMLCANEFALAIALTVFVLITVILAVLLIFLAASKNFRTVFFREKPQKKKSSKKQTQTAALSEPSYQGVDTVPIEPAPKTGKVASRRSIPEPDYLNAIPTVPLGGIPAPTAKAAQRPRTSRRAVADDAMAETIEQEGGSTYTTRLITITRARSTGASRTKSEPTNNSNKKDSKK